MQLPYPTPHLPLRMKEDEVNPLTHAVTSETILRKEQESSERYHPHSFEILTLQSDCTGIAPTEVLKTGRQPATNSKKIVEAEITEQESTLTKTPTASIDKRRRREVSLTYVAFITS